MEIRNKKEEIISLLTEKNYGLTIEEISNHLEINRATGSKYLAILEAERRVTVRVIGKAKLHYIYGNYTNGLNGHSENNGIKIGNSLLLLLFFTLFSAYCIDLASAAQEAFSLTTDSQQYSVNHEIYIYITGPASTEYSLMVYGPNGNLVTKETEATTQKGASYARLPGYSSAGTYTAKIEIAGSVLAERSFQVYDGSPCMDCAPAPKTSTTATSPPTYTLETSTTTTTQIEKAFIESIKEKVEEVIHGLDNEPTQEAETVIEVSETQRITGTGINAGDYEFTELDPALVPSKNGIRWNKVYLIESLEEGSGAVLVLTSKAEGEVLYECLNWDDEANSCLTAWEEENDLVPGEDYDLSLGQGRRALAEAVNRNNLSIEPEGFLDAQQEAKFSARLRTESGEVVDTELTAELFFPGGSVSIGPDELTKQVDGSYRIELKKRNAFRPGAYRLRTEALHDGVPYTEEYEFLWGVLALNTEKSIYLPDETAEIGIAVLNREGRMVCDAGVLLEITKPDNSIDILSTGNGLIKVSDQCEVYGVTDLPDYYASYALGGTGTYLLKLTAETIDGIQTLKTGVSVKDSVDYDVSRHGPTRIYPLVKYTMRLEVKANQDYSGEITEKVPASFSVTPQEGLSIEESGDEKTIKWSQELKAGETSYLSYEFDAPDNSPYLYALGPLTIGSFAEERNWMIASDAAGLSGMAVYQLSAQATRPRYMNWTGAAWSAAGNSVNATGTVQWMVLRDNPARDEKILGTLDSASDVLVQLWNSSSNWSASYLMTAATSINTRRAFDIGVEAGTGRVLVAYNNNTAGQVNYRIWNGTAWSAETVLSVGGTAQIEWVKLAASNSSNRMMLLAQTAATATYPDLYAVPWNGTNWLTAQLLSNQLEQATTECFDAAFEHNSDEALIVWADQANSTPRYKTYSYSSGWGVEGAGYNGGTANIVNLRLAPYPGSDRIMMCYLEGSSADFDCQEWGGNSFMTGNYIDTSGEYYAGTRNFDVAPETTSGGFIVIYGHTNYDYYSFAHCNSSARCQAGNWVIYTTWSATDIGTDTTWAQLYAVPSDPGKLIALMLDQGGTVGWWKGRLSCTASSCTSLEAPNSLGATSSVAYESAFFAFDRYVPPIQTNLSVWDETDKAAYGSLEKYVNQSVTFYANYTNTSGYPVNSTIAPDASCVINYYNVSSWTGWLAMAYSNAKGLYYFNASTGFWYPGNYSWNVSCNATGFVANSTYDKAYINNTAPDTIIDGPRATDWFARSNSAILLRCNATDQEDYVENLQIHFSWDSSPGYGSPTSWLINDTAVQNPFSVAFDAVTDLECSAANIGATGTCYYQCYANDSFNDSDKSYAQSSFKIDGEAPTGYAAAISGYAESSWLTGSDFTVQCSGGIDPGSGSGIISYDYEYTAADDCLSGWATISECTDTADSCSWSSPPADETGFCVRCRATDAVGNDGSWDNAQYSGVDNSAPTACSMTDPLQYYNVTASPYELASGESDTYSGINNVTFQYYDGLWKTACVGTSAASSYNCSWTVPGAIEDWGNIAIRAVCFDNVGLNTTSANVSNISIDVVNAAPTCTIIYPNGAENLSGTFLITASAGNTDAADYIENVSFNYSADYGGSWSIIGTNTTQGLSSYSLEWDASALNGEGFMVRCLVKDSRGSSGTDDSDAAFTVDNTMPSTTSPHINDSLLSMNEEICLNLTVTDNLALDSVWAELDVPEPGSDVNISLLDDGLGCDASSGDDVYSIVYVSTYDGSHNWSKAYANDSAGNLNWSIIGLDWSVSSNAYMTVEMLAPAADLLINESGGNTQYTQTCNVTCDLGGTACQNVVLYAEYNPGAWTEITTATTQLVNGVDSHSCGALSPGGYCSHSFTITSGEDSGNNAWGIRCKASSTTASDTPSSQVTLTINDRPHAAWDHPSAEGQWISGTFLLNASSSSDSDGPITNYLFEIDNNLVFSSPETICNGASDTCSFDSAAQTHCAQNDNVNCFIRVTVTDDYDAINSSIRRIGIDNMGPTASLDRPRNAENISADSYLVNASITDSGVGAISVASFEYRQSTAHPWTLACTDSDGAPYECSWSLLALPDAGTYEVRVRANDSLGNEGDYSTHTAIIIDRVKPSITLHDPVNGYPTPQTSINFNFTAVNSFAASFNCTLFIDSLPNASNASTQNNTVTNFTVTGLGEGLHTWFINCSDYASNVNVSETRTFLVDYTKPAYSAVNQTIGGVNVSIVHRSETVVLQANWSDNNALAWAVLSTNETGVWENKSAYGSPQDVSISNQSLFYWSSASIVPGTNFSWVIHGNDSAGNYNTTGVMNLTMWGWSEISQSLLYPSTINQSNTSVMSCRVTDNVSGSGIQDYPVSFYNSSGLMGTNASLADGWAYWNFTGQVMGAETITCSITDNATLYYNKSGEYEKTEILTVQETGAPRIFRIISDPCERGTYCRAGIVVYNPNPSPVTITNVTDRWSTDYVSSIRQCCTKDGCSAAYCSEVVAGTIRFVNQSAWVIAPYDYMVMWYEILNTNAAGTASLTANVTSVEWQPVTSTRAGVDIVNTRACAWTSWSENATNYDTNSSPTAVLKVDAGSTKEYTVRLQEYCNQAALSSANNRLVIDVPSDWGYVDLSAYWVGGGGSCSYETNERKLTCILPADLQNTYRDLKIRLTAPSILEKYNFTTTLNGTDSGGTSHGDINTHVILVKDYTAPNQTNQGMDLPVFHRGESIGLSAYWMDNYLLKGAVLSTNESGLWVNHTGRYGSPYSFLAVNQSWSEFSWQNNSQAPGSVVFWRIYANDTSGNTNQTDEMNYTVWGYSNTSTNLSNQSVLKGNPVNVSCYVADTYNGSGIHGYEVSAYSGTDLIASGTSTAGWFNTTYVPGTFGLKTITCNITHSGSLFYNATANSMASLEVNDSYRLNLTLTNSTNETFQNSTITIYDLQGSLMAESNGSVETSLQIWQEYNVVLDVEVNTTDRMVAVIRRLNITNDFSIDPQIVLNYSGDLPENVGVVTTLFALNDSFLSFNNTELQIPKNGLAVEKIIHCLNWNYSGANCSSWEVLEPNAVGMLENSTHIMFNVTGFDAWGGGAGNPLPNITQIRIYNVTGLGDTHTGGALMGTGLNTTFAFRLRDPELYRVELDVTNNGKAKWTIVSQDIVRHAGLNPAWAVNGTLDIWYTIGASTYTNGNWTNGMVAWNMSLGGTLNKDATMTFYYVVNMTDPTSANYGVNFLANDTSSNSGSNDSSTYSVAKTGYLEVLMVLPPQIPGQGNATNDSEVTYMVGANRTFIINATVYCRDGYCDNVNGTLRYNSSSVDPDTKVSTNPGDEPFYVYSGINPIDCPTNPLGVNEYCNVSWSVNATGDLHDIYSLDVLFLSNLSATNHTEDVSIETTKVIIVNLSWSTTSFGVCEPTSNGNNATLNDEGGYNITIDPNSNDVDGIYIKATDLSPESVINFSKNFYGIGVGNITWNHEDNYSDSHRLMSEYALVNDSIRSNTTIRTFYWIDIPKGQYTQDYSGKMYIMANASV